VYIKLVVLLRNYVTMMHGQQNIKNGWATIVVVGRLRVKHAFSVQSIRKILWIYTDILMTKILNFKLILNYIFSVIITLCVNSIRRVVFFTRLLFVYMLIWFYDKHQLLLITVQTSLSLRSRNWRTFVWYWWNFYYAYSGLRAMLQ
jgi:hypothetical protein